MGCRAVAAGDREREKERERERERESEREREREREREKECATCIQGSVADGAARVQRSGCSIGRGALQSPLPRSPLQRELLHPAALAVFQDSPLQHPHSGAVTAAEAC